MKCPKCERELPALTLCPVHVQTRVESMTGFGLVCPICKTLLGASLAPFVVAQTVQHLAKKLQKLHEKKEKPPKKNSRQGPRK